MENIKPQNKNWLIWLAIFIMFCTCVYVLRSVLLPFVAGIIIGYLLDPWADRFTKLGMNRTLATILVLFLVVIFFVPALVLLVGVIDEQLSSFISKIPAYMSSIAERMEPTLIELQERFPGLVADKVKMYLRENMANGLKLTGGILKGVINSGFAIMNLLSLLLITPIVAFYMLRDWDSFIAKVDDLLPQKAKASIEQQAKEIDAILAGFIRGQLSVCVLLGAFYALGLYIVGLDLGGVVGFIAGVISFIPYVGSISGLVISMALAFAQFSDYGSILQVAAVFAIGQFLEGNFLTPKLVGESVGLHPVWVMFALLAGGVLLGFLGLMVAVPAAAVIGVIVRHLLINYKNSNLYLDD